MHSVYDAVWGEVAQEAWFALNRGGSIPTLAWTATRPAHHAVLIPHRDEVSAVSSSVVNEIWDEDPTDA
jgi:hypothetical protein